MASGRASCCGPATPIEAQIVLALLRAEGIAAFVNWHALSPTSSR
jgi:hypothetical protein